MIFPMLSAGTVSGIGSAASGIGSFFNSNFGAGLTMGLGSLAGGLLSNQANAEQAHRNRVLIRQMAKNRYQWMVDDLRKAGINPIYAVQGGSAPSVTGGAVPHMSDVVTPAIGSAISVAGAINKMKIDRDIAKSQVDLNRANALNSTANAAAQLARNPYESELADARVRVERARHHDISMSSLNKTRQYEQDWQYLERRMQLQNAKDALELKILRNTVDSLKSPTWNKGVGYAEDGLDLLGSTVGSAVGVGKFANFLKRVARRR